MLCRFAPFASAHRGDERTISDHIRHQHGDDDPLHLHSCRDEPGQKRLNDGGQQEHRGDQADGPASCRVAPRERCAGARPSRTAKTAR